MSAATDGVTFLILRAGTVPTVPVTFRISSGWVRDRTLTSLDGTQGPDTVLTHTLAALYTGFLFLPAPTPVLKSDTRDSERYFYVFGEAGSIQIDDPDRPKVRLALTSAHGEFSAGLHQVPVGPSVRFIPDLDDLAGALRERRLVEHFTPAHDLAVQRVLLEACGVKS